MKKILLVIILTLTTIACSEQSEQEVKQEDNYIQLLKNFKASNNNLEVSICQNGGSYCWNWITYTIKTESDLYEYYINNVK